MGASFFTWSGVHFYCDVLEAIYFLLEESAGSEADSSIDLLVPSYLALTPGVDVGLGPPSMDS